MPKPKSLQCNAVGDPKNCRMNTCKKGAGIAAGPLPRVPQRAGLMESVHGNGAAAIAALSHFFDIVGALMA